MDAQGKPVGARDMVPPRDVSSLVRIRTPSQLRARVRQHTAAPSNAPLMFPRCTFQPASYVLSMHATLAALFSTKDHRNHTGCRVPEYLRTFCTTARATSSSTEQPPKYPLLLWAAQLQSFHSTQKTYLIMRQKFLIMYQDSAPQRDGVFIKTLPASSTAEYTRIAAGTPEKAGPANQLPRRQRATFTARGESHAKDKIDFTRFQRSSE
ncbi:hypothetical protein HPP92_029099 [Vanilla planifolia]|uniref:Uncharacterized protein n=1 Tax=Vanilla planifolia TaxID=51239 RepID=A0A835P3J7_VANPL|nr:hypothetical protein HPP92_029099 [Vanilla planifolia]KAG0445919.1 hypothetical protein HPP92_029088 [Vanilla planifolia]